MENFINFLRKIEELKLYIIKVNKNNTIKSKIYYSNYVTKQKN